MFMFIQRGGKREREGGRGRRGERDRQTDRQTGRQRLKETKRDRERHTQRQRDRFVSSHLLDRRCIESPACKTDVAVSSTSSLT